MVAGNKVDILNKFCLNTTMNTELWTSNCVLYAFGKFMNHIMNYAFFNLLQLAQYTVHRLRDLNDI